MDQLAECSKCGLVYLNPRIRSDIILESYSNAIDPLFVSQNLQRIRTFRKVFRHWLKKERITPSHEKRLLDIGCASGAFLKVANDLDFQVVGVEPSSYLCEFGKREYNLDLRPSILQDQEFKDNEFDIISMWDVIEHLDQPGKVLEEIHRILKPDGKLIINYPEYDSWPRKLLGYKWPFFLSVHLYYFTPETISHLLKNCGFRTKHCEPYLQTLELGYVLKRAGQIFTPFKWVEHVVKSIGLGRVPITYYIGQTLVTAVKRDM
jgi:2-polyprenyl-3-methyl-5-hydroxy-6-metoxy-1,4-benzoquinol methylase